MLHGINSKKWVLELGCGKGQDIFRYSDAKVSNALCIDNDNKAISELIYRLQNPKHNKCNTKVYTKIFNLTTNYRILLKGVEHMKMPIGNFDVAVMNLVFHYLY